jgi:hypothetical protein
LSFIIDLVEENEDDEGFLAALDEFEQIFAYCNASPLPILQSVPIKFRCVRIFAGGKGCYQLPGFKKAVGQHCYLVGPSYDYTNLI